MYITHLQVFISATFFILLMKKDALINHLEFKKTSINSQNKLNDIERYLRKFLDFVNKPLSKLKEEDIVKFLNSLKYSIRTINDIKTHIKVFIRWNYSDWSSRFRNLDKICKQQRPPRAYEPEQMVSIKEIEKLVKAEKDLMWKSYWLVFFYGGFRPSEACGLKWEQIFFEPKGTIIKIRTSKTGKDFYKSLPGNVEHLLKEWKGYNHSDFVFPSPIKNNAPILARSVCGRLKRLSKRVLGKAVVPYALRHSIATILYKNDKIKDTDTAKQMGHSKSMKETYMNLSEDDLKGKARNIWIKTKPLTPEEKDEIKKLRDAFNETIKLFIAGERAKTPKERARILLGLKEITERLEHNS